MDTKAIKLYEVLLKYSEKDFFLRNNSALSFIRELTEIGFDYGMLGCYYLFSKVEKLFEYKNINEDITFTYFTEIYDSNRVKTAKAVMENPICIKGFFTFADNPYRGVQMNIIAEFLEGAKADKAEVLFRALSKNDKADFGVGMVKIFDEYKSRLSAKQNTVKPLLNKKIAALFTEYAEKIKGSNKALLLQRIKELI